MTPAGPTDPTPSPTGDESELARALDAYLTSLETGRPLDPAFLAALHPDVADRLLACIAVLDVAGRPPGRDDDDDDDPPGTRLGDFVLVRPIGRGGMGVVFEARQVSLQRRVAVKVLPLAASLNPVSLGRFQVEARAAAGLHHTNIVPVFSVGRERGVHYYAMQYIEGRSLAEEIREARGGAPAASNVGDARPNEPPATEPAVESQDPIPRPDPPPRGRSDPSRYRRVAELGVQAADALEHAHRAGVVHRDVKPSNLMVDAKGTLWIADFGLARLETDVGLTLVGELLGTMRYMSPEQSSGDPARVDARTDVYALGATLYELLTLHPPRMAQGRDALLAEIADGEPRRPRSIDRRVPRDLETIVLKAMAREPSARYQTAGAMADDLRRFLDDRPILARRPSPLARAAKWARRRKALTASALLAALLAAAVLAALTLAAHNRDLTRDRRRTDHVRDVALAAHHARTGDLDEVARLLARHVPGESGSYDRDFAWRYLRGLAQSRPRRLKGHVGDVYHVEYSPDGRLLATAGQDGTIRLWNADDRGPALRVFRGHDGDVDWVAFSPDGRSLASCGNDGSVRVWDADDESKPSRVLGRADVEVVAVVFSPDGRSLFSGDHDGRLVRWDLATGRGVPAPESLGLRVQALAMTPDGRALVAACNGWPGARWIDPTSLTPIAADTGLGDVSAAAVDPTARFAAAVDHMGHARIGDLGAEGPNFRRLADLPETFVEGLAFSRDGRKLAFCGKQGALGLLDVKTGNAIRRFGDGGRHYWSVAPAPDGNVLAACGEAGAVELWDIHAQPSRFEFTADVPLVAVAAGWSDQALTTARLTPSDVRFLRWTYDDDRVEPVRSVPADAPFLAAVSPDRTTAAFWDDIESPRIRVVALDDRPDPPTPRLPASSLPPRPAVGHRLVFSPDGSALAATYPGAAGPVTAVWRVGRREPLAPPAPFSSSVRPALGLYGRRLAIAWNDDLAVWSASLGNDFRIQSGGPTQPSTAAFSNDGALAALGSESGAVAVWSLRDPSPLHLAADGPDVQALAFSPDARVLAATAASGATTLLDLAAARRLLTLDGPSSSASELRFSPDGLRLSRLAIGDESARVLVWPAAPAD